MTHSPLVKVDGKRRSQRWTMDPVGNNLQNGTAGLSLEAPKRALATAAAAAGGGSLPPPVLAIQTGTRSQRWQLVPVRPRSPEPPSAAYTISRIHDTFPSYRSYRMRVCVPKTPPPTNSSPPYPSYRVRACVCPNASQVSDAFWLGRALGFKEPDVVVVDQAKADSELGEIILVQRGSSTVFDASSSPSLPVIFIFYFLLFFKL